MRNELHDSSCQYKAARQNSFAGNNPLRDTVIAITTEPMETITQLLARIFPIRNIKGICVLATGVYSKKMTRQNTERRLGQSLFE
ncbi:MAG: hypothetical protein LBC69_00520 [Eubacteriaceae bacterium]|nr:hypothetical protein [Eubacteriaceae bacterium]